MEYKEEDADLEDMEELREFLRDETMLARPWGRFAAGDAKPSFRVGNSGRRSSIRYGDSKQSKSLEKLLRSMMNASGKKQEIKTNLKKPKTCCSNKRVRYIY